MIKCNLMCAHLTRQSPLDPAMTELERVKSSAVVRGVALGHPVRMLLVDWIGSPAINLACCEPDGGASESKFNRDDEARLNIETGGGWSFGGDGKLLSPVTETNRIAPAQHFDPFLVIHTSLVDPLPRQVSAVYGSMLSRLPLCVLQADDPGAGKTNMAGRVRNPMRDEIEPGWDPALDSHLTVWECCQHLVRKLEQGGELSAAILLRRIGPIRADAAKDLACCLYDICTDKRRSPREAASCNGLVAVWLKLIYLAATICGTNNGLQES